MCNHPGIWWGRYARHACGRPAAIVCLHIASESLTGDRRVAQRFRSTRVIQLLCCCCCSEIVKSTRQYIRRNLMNNFLEPYLLTKNLIRKKSQDLTGTHTFVKNYRNLSANPSKWWSKVCIKLNLTFSCCSLLCSFEFYWYSNALLQYKLFIYILQVFTGY